MSIFTDFYPKEDQHCETCCHWDEEDPLFTMPDTVAGDKRSIPYCRCRINAARDEDAGDYIPAMGPNGPCAHYRDYWRPNDWYIREFEADAREREADRETYRRLDRYLKRDAIIGAR